MKAYLKISSRILTTLLLISVSAPIIAEEVSGAETNLLGQEIDISNSEHTYLNGGIGIEESDAIRLRAPEFPIHISFSKGKDGESITDVDLHITNSTGLSVFESNSVGPLLYLKLPNGSYTINSKYGDVTLTSKIKVSGKKNVNLYLNWKSLEVDKDSEINNPVIDAMPSDAIPE